MGGDALSAAAAWGVLDAFRADDRVSFVSEPAEVEPRWRTLTEGRKPGANFWTDAYLAAFAGATGHTVATFDTVFRQQKNCGVLLLR